MRYMIMTLMLLGCTLDVPSESETSTQSVETITVPNDVCEMLTGEQTIEGTCYEGNNIIACAGDSDVGFCCVGFRCCGWGGGQSGCWGF